MLSSAELQESLELLGWVVHDIVEGAVAAGVERFVLHHVDEDLVFLRWLAWFHQLRVYVDWRLLALLLHSAIMRDHSPNRFLLVHLLGPIHMSTWIELRLWLPAVARDEPASLWLVLCRVAGRVPPLGIVIVHSFEASHLAVQRRGLLAFQEFGLPIADDVLQLRRHRLRLPVMDGIPVARQDLGFVVLQARRRLAVVRYRVVLLRHAWTPHLAQDVLLVLGVRRLIRVRGLAADGVGVRAGTKLPGVVAGAPGTILHTSLAVQILIQMEGELRVRCPRVRHLLIGVDPHHRVLELLVELVGLDEGLALMVSDIGARPHYVVDLLLWNVCVRGLIVLAPIGIDWRPA